MDLESVVYGLIAGAIIVLVAKAAGHRTTPEQQRQSFAFFLVAFFLFAVLQVAGVGASFVEATSIAAAVMLAYMLLRRVVVRQSR